MRLLLAEDEASLSKAVVMILKKNNYTVDAAYDGVEALEFLAANEYDGVILDVMMPRMAHAPEQWDKNAHHCAALSAHLIRRYRTLSPSP